jgi:hypothetical protein
MESIFIQVSAALYASIYERYGEQTSTVINACLSQFLGGEAPDEKKAGATQYPRPRDGTITGRVWAITDHIKQQAGIVNREDVIKACIQEGININTASTQYSHWKKANP